MVNVRSTKKITKFVSEPLSGKSVECVGGINGILGDRLCKKGYGSASALKQKAVAVKKGTFIAWLEAHVNANQLQAGWAYKSLCEHNKKFARRSGRSRRSTKSRKSRRTRSTKSRKSRRSRKQWTCWWRYKPVALPSRPVCASQLLVSATVFCCAITTFKLHSARSCHRNDLSTSPTPTNRTTRWPTSMRRAVPFRKVPRANKIWTHAAEQPLVMSSPTVVRTNWNIVKNVQRSTKSDQLEAAINSIDCEGVCELDVVSCVTTVNSIWKNKCRACSKLQTLYCFICANLVIPFFKFDVYKCPTSSSLLSLLATFNK